MDQKEKNLLIIILLYKVRKIGVTMNQLLISRGNEFTKDELEVILNDLIQSDLVESKFAIDAEGAELPILLYRLTNKCILLYEQKTENDETFLNSYFRIFKNKECFLFFRKLVEFVRERTKLADFSFIYRRMHKDGYINKSVLDSEFRDFLLKYASIELNKTKLLDYCTTVLKENNYKTTKLLFKNLT